MKEVSKKEFLAQAALCAMLWCAAPYLPLAANGFRLGWIQAVAAAVSALASLYGAYAGNKASKKGLKAQQDALNEQKKRASMFDGYGHDMLGEGKQNLDMVQNYLRSLVSGDRGLTEQAVAPEINSLTDQFRGSVAAQRNMYPRGGTTAAASASLPQQYQGQVNNLIFGVRPRASEQLGTLGSNQSSLGLGAMGQGAGLTNSMLDFGLRSRDQMFNQGAQTGQGVGNGLMMAYLMSQGRGTPSAQTGQSAYLDQSQYPNLFGGINPWTNGSNNSGGSSLSFFGSNTPSYSSYSAPQNPWGDIGNGSVSNSIYGKS